MKVLNEITPTEYASRYSRPMKNRIEFAVVLYDGTAIYGDTWQMYGKDECKVGWMSGDWTRLHITRIDYIRALED